MIKHKNISKYLSFIFLNILCFSTVFSQVPIKKDTVKAIIGITKEVSNDTIVKDEISPLDISKNRGLFIVTKDGNMQLRILGSVRFSTFYDNKELPVKNTFNTYFIPVGENSNSVVNLHNSLSQTRIGFEITRNKGTYPIFIRIETDFDDPNGYRIRHAYGQIGSFIIGKTWSLMSNVSDLPHTVDKNGPTGTIANLVPQIRFGKSIGEKYNWALSLEYATPELYQYNEESETTENAYIVQMIPDFSGKFKMKGKLGSIQLSTVINNTTIKKENGDVSNLLGFGVSVSGKLNTAKKQNLFFQFAYGKSNAHYISTFSHAGQDAIYNPISEKYEGLNALGAFISYAYNWNPKISTNLSLGFASISNKYFQLENEYSKSYSTSLDALWRVIEGARIGVSYTYGKRENINNITGSAGRLWALVYYDF